MIKYLAFFCMILLSCNNKFVRQPSNSDILDVTPECQNLVKVVNENWYKHRKYPCHKEFPQVFTLANQYQKCFLGLHKADIIMMLGEPDVKTTTNFEYIFRRKCGKNKSADYSKLIIQFKSNSVVGVESELHSLIE